MTPRYPCSYCAGKRTHAPWWGRHAAAPGCGRPTDDEREAQEQRREQFFEDLADVWTRDPWQKSYMPTVVTGERP